MAAMLDDQGLFDQRHRIIASDAQPQVIVLTDRQRLIEAAAPIEQFPGHHHCRRTDKTEIETPLKNVPRWFAMLDPWIDSDTMADPNLIGLANWHFR